MQRDVDQTRERYCFTSHGDQLEKFDTYKKIIVGLGSVGCNTLVYVVHFGNFTSFYSLSVTLILIIILLASKRPLPLTINRLHYSTMILYLMS